jgi:hypothetical protein
MKDDMKAKRKGATANERGKSKSGNKSTMSYVLQIYGASQPCRTEKKPRSRHRDGQTEGSSYMAPQICSSPVLDATRPAQPNMLS